MILNPFIFSKKWDPDTDFVPESMSASFTVTGVNYEEVVIVKQGASESMSASFTFTGVNYEEVVIVKQGASESMSASFTVQSLLYEIP